MCENQHTVGVESEAILEGGGGLATIEAPPPPISSKPAPALTEQIGQTHKAIENLPARNAPEPGVQPEKKPVEKAVQPVQKKSKRTSIDREKIASVVATLDRLAGEESQYPRTNKGAEKKRRAAWMAQAVADLSQAVLGQDLDVRLLTKDGTARTQASLTLRIALLEMFKQHKGTVTSPKFLDLNID